MILSGGSAMIMYENDEIHLTGVGIDDLPRILDPNDPLNPELHRSPQDFDVFYVGLNAAEPPFEDPKVRQALNYAVDLQSIADIVYDGRLSPARGVIPPGFPSYTQNLRSYEYNPDLARELLQQSTYADALASGDFPRITLTISGSFGASVPQYLEVMLEQWRSLGIEVEIQQTEWPLSWKKSMKAVPYVHSGWIADYPDPENFLDLLFHSESNNNHTNYSNPEVDRLLEEARIERDRERRFESTTRLSNDSGRRALGVDLVQRRWLRPHQAGGVGLLPPADEHTEVPLHLLQPVAMAHAGAGRLPPRQFVRRKGNSHGRVCHQKADLAALSPDYRNLCYVALLRFGPGDPVQLWAGCNTRTTKCVSASASSWAWTTRFTSSTSATWQA